MSKSERRRVKGAFDSSMWKARACGEYEKLGWVSAPGPLEKVIELSNLKGHETVVDVGTGSQAILHAVTPFITSGRLLGFDISSEMMRRSVDGRSRAALFQADTFSIPLPNDFADLVTIRMVLHHTKDIPSALTEMKRILKPEGRLLAGEYVAVDEEVKTFERVVFDIKEKDRHLWTGFEFAALIREGWNDRTKEPQLGYGILPQYSARDWMSKSGLPTAIQTAVLNCYLDAPGNIVEKMNITLTEDGDALVDRPFAYVVIEK